MYGDPYHRQTDKIWNEVASFVYDNYRLPLLFLGDMNEILYAVDKNSPNINRSRMYDFRALVKNCGLFDLGYSGPAYTWTNKRFSSKPTFERLDRCLVNSEWCDVFPVSNVYNMPIFHCYSDHAAILLSTEGPVRKIKKHFKFENWWLKEQDFQDYAKSMWNNSKNKSFSNRTNHLAGSLKIWCKKKKPLQQKLDNLEEQIKQIQVLPWNDQDHILEANLTTRYEQTMTKLTDFYMQRAKKQWIKDGDRNTSFFHRAIVKRKKRNTIASIKDEHDVLQCMPDRISNTFVNYFRSIFASSHANTGRPFSNTPPSSDINDYTYTIPDEKEILETLKDMKRNASPGPDGFNVEFYLATWDWISQDVVQLVRNFFQTGIMPSHINDTHIALIPKKLVPLVPADYRPISLCNVIYKIIAKCIANRLKPHLPDYIHPSQQAFIEGRRISNNIIIAQEITHSFALSSWNEKAFMLKIDLAKAFDRLEWNFIVSALERKGLHNHFINLIYSCVSSPCFSVIINGQPYAKFKSQRGIRQGCPLSPYLFVLAINELSIALQEAMSMNEFAGITLGPNCPSIHSLLFADDLLVCGQATSLEAIRMKSIIQEFCSRSGQIPNWSKSGIIFSKNVDINMRITIKHTFPVPDIDNNFMHLGHPLVIPGRNRNDAYNFIVDKFKSKLSSYKADKLSHAARLELIKSVFSSIPVYYMSNIIFSKKFIAKLTTIIRSFWWTGVREETNAKSLCLKAWKDICAPRKEGGLGIRNLQAINQGLILMAAWRIAEQPDNFLHAVLKSKYFPDSSIWRPNSSSPKSAFWSSILKVLPILKENSFYQISQGNSSIWSTPWCTGWSNIYDSLITQPHDFTYPAQVKDLWETNQKTWNVTLIDTLFQQPFAGNIKRIAIIDTQEKDMLCWKLTPSGKCNSKSAYWACLKNLQEKGEPKPRQVHSDTKILLNKIWKDKTLIPRVQTFGWRFLSKSMPTGARAGKYSKHISKLCCRCGMEEDDIHLFFTCCFSKAAWFSEPWFIRTEILVNNTSNLTQILQKMLDMNHPHVNLNNVLTFMWCIWKARNDKLFNRKDCHPRQIQHAAHAINQNMEKVDLLQVKKCSSQGGNAGNINRSQDEGRDDLRQGESIKTDLLIQGIKIYTDAAWKTRKAPGSQGRIATGMGVFCQFPHSTGENKVLIQASSPKLPSPLHAEAAALLLAAKFAEKLNASPVTFLTDNLILARAAASEKITDFSVPWELREQIAHYKKASTNIQVNIFHIKRDINGVAHNCSHQALTQSQSMPIYSCSYSAHDHSNCPVLLALQNINTQGIVIHAVHCL
jgi:hypothetical protein